MIQNVWLIPAFPLAAFLVNGLLGRRWLHKWTGIIASVAVGLAIVLSAYRNRPPIDVDEIRQMRG